MSLSAVLTDSKCSDPYLFNVYKVYLMDGNPQFVFVDFKTFGGNLMFRIILIGLANLDECARIVDDPSTKNKHAFPVYIGLSFA